MQLQQKMLHVFSAAFLFGIISSSANPVEASVIQVKSWTRNSAPVVFKIAAVPVLNGQPIDQYYVWSMSGGVWEQIVFQVDEMAANPGWSGYTPDPFINYFMWDDLDNGPDVLMGDGMFSAEDELVFMADALGDQVTPDEWPPGVPVTWNRLELHFVDPLNPGDQGWIYIFRDNTSPVWTTDDYVDWLDVSGAEKTIDADGYRISYISDGPDSWIHSPTLDHISIKPENGGDNLDLLDVHKNTANIRVWIFDVAFCQTDTGVETYFEDETASRPHWVWGVKDGPVRVIRQYRMRGQAGGSQWGYHPYYTTKHYRYSTHINERFYINTTMTWNWGETSFDHNAGAVPLTYRDQLGNTGTIDGISTNDTVAIGGIPDWVLVTSTHGSYHLSMDVESVQCSSMQNVWNDYGSGASEAATCQTANGRYGDFGYRWDSPGLQQNTYLNWRFTFLPDSTENSETTGESLHESNLTPIPAPSVTEQAYIAPTATPTSLATSTPTNTPTPEPTHTPTLTPTNTPTQSPTSSPAYTPTHTPTLTPTDTPTRTPSNTPTATFSPEPSVTPSASPSDTPLPTDTPIPTETAAPTLTPTGEPTDTPTPSPTVTPLPIPASGPVGLILMLIIPGICLLSLRKLGI